MKGISYRYVITVDDRHTVLGGMSLESGLFHISIALLLIYSNSSLYCDPKKDKAKL